MRLLASGAALMLALTAAARAEGEFIPRRQQARAAFATTGAGLYAHYCAACHGAGGKGDGPWWSSELPVRPADLTALPADPSYLEQAIAQGSTAHGKSALCPPWARSIPEAQRRRLARHILDGLTPAPATPRTRAAGAPPREPFPWLPLIISALAATALVHLARSDRRCDAASQEEGGGP